MKRGKKIWWRGEVIEGRGRRRQAPQAVEDVLKVKLLI